MSDSLQKLNEKRKSEYYKDRGEEEFLRGMNEALRQRELALYKDYPIEHPFIFVFGLPRSGTTLITQLIAHSLDVGYINNLMARFWLAPLHGIRLSRHILKNQKQITFQSDYARTPGLGDVHEFGYFWRYWLKKETLEDVTHAGEREAEIDWQGLRRVLATMQHEFDKSLVFKNIFGSYHLKKMREVLHKVIYVYIERDPLDVAVSILEARKKYYEDWNTWWSYTPVEYDLLKGRNYWEQIAGQVYFLRRYYHRQIQAHCADVTVQVSYPELCAHPADVLQRIQRLSVERYGYSLTVTQSPPESFPLRTYEDREEEKRKFADLIEEFVKTYGSY